MAVCEDHIDMAEFLLREGADVNIVDKDQRLDQNNVPYLASISTFGDFSKFFFYFSEL